MDLFCILVDLGHCSQVGNYICLFALDHLLGSATSTFLDTCLFISNSLFLSLAHMLEN